MNKKRQKQSRKRMAQAETILRDDLVTHVYIKKDGWFYRPDCRGYTESPTEAGVYPKGQYAKYGLSCVDIAIIPICNDKHNAMLQQEIEELQSRIIND